MSITVPSAGLVRMTWYFSLSVFPLNSSIERTWGSSLGAEDDKISKNRITVETDKLTSFAILVKERSDSVF